MKTGVWFIIANMDDLQPNEMRRRIRELLSIPDRDRTDAEWDELNELEIRTAPGNRDYDRPQDNRQGEKRQIVMGLGRRDRNNKGNNKNVPPRQQQEGGRPEGGGGNRLLKRQHRRPKRPMQENSGFNNAMNDDPGLAEIPLNISIGNSEKSED